MHPAIQYDLAQVRHAELLREAERARLAASVERGPRFGWLRFALSALTKRERTERRLPRTAVQPT